MNQPAGSPTALERLYTSLSAVWQTYQEAGPGNVNAELFEPVAAATPAALEEAGPHEALTAAINTAVDLTRRCATQSQGLCFVTGEAGLLPRRDQHEALEAALSEISTAIDAK